jgi:hypothetical protein
MIWTRLTCGPGGADRHLALPKRSFFVPARVHRRAAGRGYRDPPASAVPGTLLALLQAADVAAAFPPRDPASHKGTFGHVLVVAGSVGKTGAAALCALAAQRGGAGLVTLGVPESLNDILEVKLTEVMTEPLPETEARTLAGEALDRLAIWPRARAPSPSGLAWEPIRTLRNWFRSFSCPSAFPSSWMRTASTPWRARRTSWPGRPVP